MIEIRDSLFELSVNPDLAADSQEGAKADAGILNQLLNMYAELIAQSEFLVPRTLIPDVVVTIWEHCFKDHARADITLLCTDGRAKAHSLLLSQASPVVAAMLASGMREGESREISLPQSLRVVELFLALIHTGCLPENPAA